MGRPGPVWYVLSLELSHQLNRFAGALRKTTRGVRGTPSFSKAIERVSTQALSIIANRERLSHDEEKDAERLKIAIFGAILPFDFGGERTRLEDTT